MIFGFLKVVKTNVLSALAILLCSFGYGQSKGDLSKYLGRIVTTVNDQDIDSWYKAKNGDVALLQQQTQIYKIEQAPGYVLAAIEGERKADEQILKAWDYYLYADPQKMLQQYYGIDSLQALLLTDVCFKKETYGAASTIEGAMLLKEKQGSNTYVAFFGNVHFREGEFYGYMLTDVFKTELTALTSYPEMLIWKDNQLKLRNDIKTDTLLIPNDSTISKVVLTWQKSELKKANFFNNEQEVFTYKMTGNSKNVHLFELYKRAYYVKLIKAQGTYYLEKVNADGIIHKAVALTKSE